MSCLNSDFLLLLFYVLVHLTVGSHFRGGIITWKPLLDSTPNTVRSTFANYTSIVSFYSVAIRFISFYVQVQFSFKNAWRRSYSGMYCDRDTIRKNDLIGPTSDWTCVAGCEGSPSIASTQFYCTTFSVQEDWSQGENTFTYTFPGPGPFVVR